MKTYRLEFHTVSGVEIFIIDAHSLDEAIRAAGVTARVLWVTGQVTL